MLAPLFAQPVAGMLQSPGGIGGIPLTESRPLMFFNIRCPSVRFAGVGGFLGFSGGGRGGEPLATETELSELGRLFDANSPTGVLQPAAQAAVALQLDLNVLDLGCALKLDTSLEGAAARGNGAQI